MESGSGPVSLWGAAQFNMMNSQSVWPADVLYVVSLFYNLFYDNEIIMRCFDLDRTSWGCENGIHFVRLPFVGAHPAQPELRRRFPGDVDWQFSGNPEDAYFHGTTMHCFPARCSATRLLRGDRPKDNKFAVNLSRDFTLACGTHSRLLIFGSFSSPGPICPRVLGLQMFYAKNIGLKSLHFAL